MMCLPASVGLSRPPVVALPPGVSFIGASGGSTATATSVSTPNTPSGVLSGDGLFAFVSPRSSSGEPIITAPSGWTLVAQTTTSYFGAAFRKLAIYRRDSAGPADSSASFTWTHDTGSFITVGYLLVRSSTGALSVAAHATFDTTEFSPATVPVQTAAGDGELLVMAAGLVISDEATWTAPTGAVLRSITTQETNFLGFATQGRNTGQSNSSPFGITSSGGLVGTASITMRLQSA